MKSDNNYISQIKYKKYLRLCSGCVIIFTKYETGRKKSTSHYFGTRDYIIEHDIRNNILIFYILGTFTCLCARKSKTQVVALAMQLDYRYKDIKLTIVEN